MRSPLHGTLGPGGGASFLSKMVSPSMTNGQERVTPLGAFPIFSRCNRRPPKPVWRGDTREDSVEGIRGPPLFKPCTWGRSPCIVAKCLPKGLGLGWAIWECRPSKVESYARFWQYLAWRWSSEGLTFEWRSICLRSGWVSLRFGSPASQSSQRIESPPFGRRPANAIPLSPREAH